MTTKLRVVAFLQCQWFKDPERVRQTYARHPGEDFRRRFIATTLFMGCLTGRRLAAVFGPRESRDPVAAADWTGQIVWEETSREIGGEASSFFPPDLDHMSEVLRSVVPCVVLAFGAPARAALQAMANIFNPVRDGENLYSVVPLDAGIVPFYAILAPHPAARGAATVPGLIAARESLDKFLRAS